MKADIYWTKKENTLSVKTRIGTELVWHDLNLDDIKGHHKVDTYITAWMLDKITKPVLMQSPLDEIKYYCEDRVKKEHRNALFACVNVITETDNKIKELADLKGVSDNQENILFFNFGDDLRYKSLYERLKRNYDKEVFYLNLDSPWDKVKRTWTGKGTLPMSLDDLIDFIVRNNIKKVLSVNHYLEGRYCSFTAVNITFVLRYLGVDYITFFHDPPELTPAGYLTKSYFDTFPENIHYYGMSVLNEYWDKKYKFKNSRYMVMPQDYNSNGRPWKLSKDYDIIVLSNSRLNDYKEVVTQTDIVLNSIPEETLFTDIQLWYMACRHLILNVYDLTDARKLHINSELHRFFFAIVNHLKHRIVNNLKTNRKVRVFGDEGWQEICPQYYEGHLDHDGMEKLFAEDNHLYLLMNMSFSYLDASGPVYDMIRRCLPFINVPPIAKTALFADMYYLEYKNQDELNLLLKIAGQSPYCYNLKKALGIYRKILDANITDIETSLNGDRSNSILFESQRKQHNQLIEQKVLAFLDKQEPFVRQTNNLFFGI